jgi:hypothetical protein
LPEKIRVKDEKLKEEMLGKKVAYFANKRAVLSSFKQIFIPI